jgi:hypothetical protein
MKDQVCVCLEMVYTLEIWFVVFVCVSGQLQFDR